MSSISSTYDVIFAGGGATACVAAGRLADSKPSLKILMIEAGPHINGRSDIIQPGRFLRNLNLPLDTFSFHSAKPSKLLGNRSISVASGRCVGGGSSVNFVTYTRAAASDYDDWETAYGNKGWGSKDIIPLLKKAETYQAPSTNSTHGDSGPLKISFATSECNIGEQFLAVARDYDKTRGTTDDINAFYHCNEYGRWARYIDGESGRRSDAAHNYIYNRENHQNLHILDRCRITRVLFEGNKAIGVEYVSDVEYRRRTGSAQVSSVARASRLVVLSAGAFGSPAILERSGIGSPDILKKNGIEILVDLPGVGEHYMDHNLVFVPYFASEEADTLDTVFNGTDEELEPYVEKWTREGKGLLAHNAQDAGIKIRPNESDLEELGPAFKERWESYFSRAPDKPVMAMGAYAAYTGNIPSAPKRKYFSMEYYTAYPVSIGKVHVTSGIDPYAKMDFEPGFMEDPADLVVLRWIYKRSREIARRMNSYRGEFDLGHPKFAPDSQAACKPMDGPVDISAPDIVYTAEDNKAIDEYIRNTVRTTWHSMGTCAMKPRERGGVVDERLGVYGVNSLKVADCSIAPYNVGANTYNTAIAIGEKAAIIVAEDLETIL